MQKSARTVSLSGRENTSCFSQKKNLASTHSLHSPKAECGLCCFFLFYYLRLHGIPRTIPGNSKNKSLSCYISLGISNFPMLCPS